MGGDVLRRSFRGFLSTPRGRRIRKQYFRFNILAEFTRNTFHVPLRCKPG